MNTTPNSIVVTAIDEHVRSVVGSDAYRRAKDDHRKVLQESEKLLERVDNAIPVDFAAPRKTERAGQTVGGKRKVRTNTSPAKSARKTSASRTPRGSAVADNG
jgi:hypothetical protein